MDLGQASCYYQTTAFQRMDLTPSSDVKVGGGHPVSCIRLTELWPNMDLFIYLFAVDLMALFSNLTI
jgi:hypothetical protein